MYDSSEKESQWYTAAYLPNTHEASETDGASISLLNVDHDQ